MTRAKNRPVAGYAARPFKIRLDRPDAGDCVVDDRPPKRAKVRVADSATLGPSKLWPASAC